MASSSSASRFVVGDVGLLRCAERCQADKEEHRSKCLGPARPRASGRSMPSASSNRPALNNQPAPPRSRRGRPAGRGCSDRRLLAGAPRRRGEEQRRGRGKQGAQEGADRHACFSEGVFAGTKKRVAKLATLFQKFGSKGSGSHEEILILVIRLLLGCTERAGNPGNIVNTTDSGVELASRGHRVIVSSSVP